jgi:LuxR family maltose regulon positive regulatory protein
VTGPLLETKLHVPRRRPGLVARGRLGERLRSAGHAGLVLVSAPAGFGKTTLLTEWLADTGRTGCTAWLALDQRDNDPVGFWTYVVAALRKVGPDIGAGALALLRSPGSALQDVVAALLNDLHDRPDGIVLVLDDYHVVESPDVHEAMAFLLDHLPQQLQVVIATRVDPPLPLARYRGSGTLVELRAADLRFTGDEAGRYLATMGLALTAGHVAALEERTEGWIAALQLAALSMQGRADVAGFIAGFAGDDRFIVDYLVEEVLTRQPEPVRDFLLQTSVLARLTGPLCDAVTRREGGSDTLDALDRANLFVVRLDDRRSWYRYHHLFGDVLRARLLHEQPGQVPGLHLRASEWHEGHGDPAEAIRHALAGGHAERAATLIEQAIPEMGRQRREATVRQWFEDLPAHLVRSRPGLHIGYVGTLMSLGRTDGVEQRLQEIERTPAGPDVAGRLPATIAMYRAGLALLGGDLAGTLAHAERVLALTDGTDLLERGAALALAGLAQWTSGELQDAERAYSASVQSLQEAGHLSDVLGCSLALADIRLAQGRLGAAVRALEGGLAAAAEAGQPALRGTADMHVGVAEVLLERGDATGAALRLAQGAELGESAGLPQSRYRSLRAHALLRKAEGDLPGALALLEQAERLYVGDYSPDVRPVAATRVRVHLAAGELVPAVEWARERGLSATDGLSYLREYEHVTLTRVLLARAAAERSEALRRDASGLLGRLLVCAQEGGRTGTVVEVLVLLALHSPDLPAGLAHLQRALLLAEPEGYVALFRTEGAPLTPLLAAAARDRVHGAHARRLLAASEGPATPARSDGLPEPLSDRELAVLRLLASDLTGPDIARRLVVSLNTLRTHTSHIYAKLGVSSRRTAVRRAGELGLL